VADSSRWGWRDLVTVLLCVAGVLVARSSLADHYRVPSGSMEPTVEVGDHVLVDKRAYGWRLPLTSVHLGSERMPARGDVVVLESPEDGMVLLKRVVAVAGDKVAVREGRLFIDGEAVAVDERRGMERLGGAEHPVALGDGGPPLARARVPEGRVLVMGDNRANSHDGRAFGFVDVHAVLGRAVAIYFREGELAWIDL
jgi:signal peptidase I